MYLYIPLDNGSITPISLTNKKLKIKIKTRKNDQISNLPTNCQTFYLQSTTKMLAKSTIYTEKVTLIVSLTKYLQLTSLRACGPLWCRKSSHSCQRNPPTLDRSKTNNLCSSWLAFLFFHASSYFHSIMTFILAFHKCDSEEHGLKGS